MPDHTIKILSAIGGGLLTAIAVPLIARVCHRRGWLDRPDARKLHEQPTPRLTGVPLFVAIWLPIIVVAVLDPDRLVDAHGHLLAILLGAFAVLALGLIDDLRPVPGATKLLFQLLIGCGLYAAGVGFSQLWIPFVGGIALGWLSLPVSLIWFLILINAVNVIDGLDGLATATTGVASLAIIWISSIYDLTLIGLGAAGLFGGLTAFWFFNRPPAKVFMGDTGSLSLGYFLAVAAMLAPIKRFTVVAFFVPLIAMALPLSESLLTLVRRLATGRPLLNADRGHLHHRLLQAGWQTPRIVAAYALITLAFSIFSVLLHYVNHRAVAACLGIFVLSIMGGLGIIFRRSTSGRQS